MTGRIALADVLAAELDIDLTPAFMAAVDKILMRLWLHGYAILPAPEEELDEPA